MRQYRIKKDFLTINSYSRPSIPLHTIKGIIIHWVGNPKSTAKANRNYFELRKNGKHGYGSAHFIIDENTIIQCIPETEMAYHVGAKEYTDYAIKKYGTYPNDCTIGIELCHNDWSGKFTKAVLEKAIWLAGNLSEKYKLNPLEDIDRHYDITKKLCPKWFVEHEEDYINFKLSVYNYLTNGELINV